MGKAERWVLRSARDSMLMVSESNRDFWTSNIDCAKTFESSEKAMEWRDSLQKEWLGKTYAITPARLPEEVVKRK